jgi:hypothetical protein
MGQLCTSPGSNKIVNRDELPENSRDLLVPFEAKAGDIIAMDGRVWHTSGSNVTKDQGKYFPYLLISPLVCYDNKSGRTAIITRTILEILSYLLRHCTCNLLTVDRKRPSIALRILHVAPDPTAGELDS